MKSTRRMPQKTKGKKSQKWRREQRLKAEQEKQRRKQARDNQTTAEFRIHGDTAERRFEERQVIFEARFGALGSAVHAAASLTHNAVAHPLLGLMPSRLTLAIHDITADWLNQSPTPSQSPLPQIEDRLGWLLHNCIAHPLMAVAPRSAAFDLHESTAESMAVDGWV